MNGKIILFGYVFGLVSTLFAESVSMSSEPVSVAYSTAVAVETACQQAESMTQALDARYLTEDFADPIKINSWPPSGAILIVR